jgi:hypothetical protein
MFFPHHGDLIVIVIRNDLQNILRACLHTFAATVTFIGINDKIVIARAIGITIVGNIAPCYYQPTDKPTENRHFKTLFP